MMFSSLVVLALSSVASAHFRLTYPYWRGDSFAEGRSQWNWPCASVSQENSTNNRTEWPIDGGQLVFTPGHPWAYTYVNLGIGNNVTSFNVSLAEGFNQTGNGTFCFQKLGTAALADLAIKEGTNASIQVIQISHSGAALYNCADITFSSKAVAVSSDVCKNSTGIGAVKLENAGSGTSANGSSTASASKSGSAASPSSTGSGTDSNAVKMGVLIGALAVGVTALLV